MDIELNKFIITDYFNILEQHYKKRYKELELINSPFKKDGKVYVNLDFINKYSINFHFDDNTLCGDKYFREKQIFGKGKVGIAKLINVNGKHQLILKENLNVINPKINNLHLVIKKINHININHIKFSPSIEYNKYHLSNYDNQQKDEYVLLTVPCDNFSNQTCIHLIINLIFKNLPYIKNYIYQYDAFYCNTSSGLIGKNILEFANKGDLSNFLEQQKDNINESFLIDLLMQIFIPLGFLKNKKYGFTHADLKCKNIFVKEEFNEETQITKYIYKIADFDKSSIYWKNIRFYNNDISILNKYGINITDLLNYHGYDIKYENDIPYYTLSGSLPPQIYIMFSWFPIYESYDYYTFIYSLIREPVIHNYMENNKNSILWDICKYLWFSNDLNKIYNDIGSDIKNSHIDIVIKKLRSIKSINVDLKKNNIKLKININPLYDILKINEYCPDKIDTEIDIYHSNRNYLASSPIHSINYNNVLSDFGNPPNNLILSKYRKS